MVPEFGQEQASHGKIARSSCGAEDSTNFPQNLSFSQILKRDYAAGAPGFLEDLRKVSGRGK